MLHGGFWEAPLKISCAGHFLRGRQFGNDGSSWHAFRQMWPVSNLDPPLSECLTRRVASRQAVQWRTTFTISGPKHHSFVWYIKTHTCGWLPVFGLTHANLWLAAVRLVFTALEAFARLCLKNTGVYHFLMLWNLLSNSINELFLGSCIATLSSLAI